MSWLASLRGFFIVDEEKKARLRRERQERLIETERERQQALADGPQTCPSCGGGGACFACRGNPVSWRGDRQEVCNHCNGSGSCMTCGGRGLR